MGCGQLSVASTGRVTSLCDLKAAHLCFLLHVTWALFAGLGDSVRFASLLNGTGLPPRESTLS